MGVYMKNGIPLHGPSLCETCVRAHIEKGFSESETTIFCQATWPEHRVRFRVRECSDYLETRRQTLKQMEDTAWVLMPRDGKRMLGFVRPGEVPEDQQIKIELNEQK